MDKEDLIYLIKRKLDEKYKIMVSYNGGPPQEELHSKSFIQLSRYEAEMILQALGADEW